MTTLDRPPTSALPAGLHLRPYAGEVDVPAIVEIINGEWEGDGVPGRTTIGEKIAQFASASEMFDARRDVTVAEVDGAAVAYAIRGWVDAADSHLREYRVDGAVVPACRDRGIGRAVLRESMRRATQLALGHDTPRLRAFGSMGLYESAGFAVEHRSTAWRKPFEV